MKRLTKLAYRQMIDEACMSAGKSDEHWNSRFIVSLKARGLHLTQDKKVAQKFAHTYPDGSPCLAPLPYGNNEAWPAESYVVWSAHI